MYVCAFFIIWYPRACARYGVLGSVLVPARRAVVVLVLSVDFGFGAAASVASGDLGSCCFWVRGPICIVI